MVGSSAKVTPAPMPPPAAQQAKTKLDDLVRQFAFDTPRDRATWHTLALTAVATQEGLYSGPRPGFVLWCPRREATGKSMLANLASLVASKGRRCQASFAGKFDRRPDLSCVTTNGLAVWEKMVSYQRSMADSRVFFDWLDSGSLTYRGKMYQSRTVPVITGNAVTVGAGIRDRFLCCRVRTHDHMFVDDFDYAVQKRLREPAIASEYYDACATILRAYDDAGRPGERTRAPMPGREEWDRFVVGAACWVGWSDPLDGWGAEGYWPDRPYPPVPDLRR